MRATHTIGRISRQPQPQQAYQVFDYLSGEIDQQLDALQQVIDEDVTQFANLVRDLDVPTIAT